MTRAWFIDALDARGGLAFASHRLPDLQEEIEDVEAPAVHLSAPSFAPEPLASRATGLSAARAGFQFGLFVEGVEVGFEELDDLINFVRRAYGASGGADGSNDPGRAPPPSPPPDGGTDGASYEGMRHEGEPPKGSGAVGAMLAMIDEASKRVGATAALMRQELGTSSMLLAHAEPIKLASDGSDGSGALEWAAVTLGCELVRRLPTSREDLPRWLDAMSSLCRAAWDLDLDGRILDHRDLVDAGRHVFDDRLTLLFDADVAEELGGPPSDEVAASVAACIMGCRFDFLDLESASLSHMPGSVWWGTWRYESWLRLTAPTGPERFSTLARWPLPSSTAARLNLDAATSTLADLLCAMTAAPMSSPGDTLDASLLLFAATHLVGEPQHSWFGQSSGDPRTAWRERQLRQAEDWLVRQFPKRIFDPAIEALIGEAKSLRYGPATRKER